MTHPWVTFNPVVEEQFQVRWIRPHGRTQLNFPRTKWVFDVPADVEDSDGDIEMTDA